nr:hypothetical protein [Micromonospora phaseoli]
MAGRGAAGWAPGQGGGVPMAADCTALVGAEPPGWPEVPAPEAPAPEAPAGAASLTPGRPLPGWSVVATGRAGSKAPRQGVGPTGMSGSLDGRATPCHWSALVVLCRRPGVPPSP